MIQYVAVLPAYAGMFPTLSFVRRMCRCSPRVCGDVSQAYVQNPLCLLVLPAYAGMFLGWIVSVDVPESSPRVCGDVSPRPSKCLSSSSVLPAYAGMFPSLAAEMCALACSPRVCGDVSRSHQDERRPRGFSPRMRGCFHRTARGLYKKLVLPAYAGMFPPVRIRLKPLLRSPRVCGDVSKPEETSLSSR